jgi:Ca-activated chloride channel family protein
MKRQITPKKHYIYLTVTFMLSFVLLFSTGCGQEEERYREKVDDWNISTLPDEENGQVAVPASVTPSPVILVEPQQMSAGNSGKIGLSAGGAKDINNFRENIQNDYLPLATDITYEGLFYDYYFDTGQSEECRKLFCPSYTYAITTDPISDEIDYYLSVGLNSGMEEKDFQRKKLNLVIVLDISGSMSSPFNLYYYDQFGNRVTVEDEDEENTDKAKITVATESIVDLIDHLNNDDRFGMVLFNNDAYLAKPLNLVGDTDMDAIRDHILEISANGGTHLSAGMQMATDLYDDFLDIEAEEYENRIIFLTDAMPNIGDTSEQGLLGMTRNNADNGVYTTFIGIGVDFNTELTEYITKIRGANYYSVHSAKQFEERMDEEFEYMVTPLVFDLQLVLEADGWEIEKVYGSPEANEATGELMKVNTLFPSKKEGDETKGGLILLKLKKTGSESSLTLKVSYEDRKGKIDGSETTIKFGEDEPELFENNGIRKGILLARYADLMKNWIIDEQEHAHISRPWEPRINDETGILIPPVQLGQWERQSLPLAVTEEYRELFKEFCEYFGKETGEIGDDTLSQELEILEKLIDY